LFVAEGTELWKSDGTPEGTVKVKPVPGGFPLEAGELIYLWVREPQGYSLWRTDGTEEGTIRVRDGFVAKPPYRFGFGFAEARGRLIFNADDGVHGNELWVSDGTPPGTSMVLDLTPGPADSMLSFARGSGDLAYFSAGTYPNLPAGLIEEGPWGGDLWQTDGTPEGTKRLAVIPVGELLGGTIVRFEDQLLFTALDGPHGWEIWSYPLGARPPLRGDANGDGRRDVSDAIAILGCLFLGQACPPESCGIDVNSDAKADVSDVISLLEFLFLGGAALDPCP
jgi:ELWxxDGT repeat protein